MKKSLTIKGLILLLIIVGIQLINCYNYIVLGNDTIVDSNESRISLSSLDVQVNTSDHKYKARQRKASVNIYHEDKKLNVGKDYTLTYENNIEVGTATVVIQGIGNYTGTITEYYNIIPQHIKNLDVKVDTSNHTYTGKKRKASVKIYHNGIKLKVNEDYSLEYKNAVKTGKATVIIRGQGNYSGKIKKTYKIVPKKATIKEVIMNSKNTEATIKWKKDSQADGYVIYRATSKNGEYKKIKNISDKNRTSYTVKKLSSKKAYYFKIRSYKMFGDKKGYSKKYSDSKTNSGLLAKITLTSTSSNKSRNTNLKVASKAINGLVLKPGQTFNWFNVVGKATIEKGYKSATVFVNKKPVPGVGGGICQVSTTLYQAAKKSGLKIVERHTHSLPVTYTTKGKDATVAYGVKNLRIKNNKKYSIKFVTTSDDNKTTCKIYRINN